MWEWFTNRGLKTFCHLRNERSFEFQEEFHSLICHRCSGIYSGFLIIFILCFILNYQGSLKKNTPPKMILLFGCALLSLSVIQVLIQKVSSNPLLTGGSSRFFVGCLTGIGLLHLYFGLQEKATTENKKTWVIVTLIGSLLIHTFLSHQFLQWINLTAISGIVLVYFLMNTLVVESLFPKLTYFSKILLTLSFIALEWSLLYWNNVIRPHHG